jgi:hypothetical protein
MVRITYCFIGLACLLGNYAYSQQRGKVKLDAIQAGVSWVENEFKDASFPFVFEKYLANGETFPTINHNTFYGRGSGLQQDFLWQLDADWRRQKSGQRKFWHHARWHTGVVYGREFIAGQDVGVQTISNTPGGFTRTIELYGNDMQYNLLGLQLGWKQLWYPFKRVPELAFYTGLSWVNMWTLRNEITQSSYYLQTSGTTAGGYQVIEERTNTLPNLAAKNFVWQRWQIPLGITCNIVKRIKFSTEFNLGVSRKNIEGNGGPFYEAHGFSARIGYYF